MMKFMIIWFLLAFLLLPLVQPKSIFAIAYCFPPLFIIMARAADVFRHSINLFILAASLHWSFVAYALSGTIYGRLNRE